MFIQITDHQGNQVGIDPLKVIKIRTSDIADEPRRMVFVDYASNGVFARGTLTEIVRLFAPYIRLAALHAPNGKPIFLNADGIAAVGLDGGYDGRSVAIASTGFENIRVPARNKIGLRETVAEAEQIIEGARRRAVVVK